MYKAILESEEFELKLTSEACSVKTTAFMNLLDKVIEARGETAIDSFTCCTMSGTYHMCLCYVDCEITFVEEFI